MNVADKNDSNTISFESSSPVVGARQTAELSYARALSPDFRSSPPSDQAPVLFPATVGTEPPGTPADLLQSPNSQTGLVNRQTRQATARRDKIFATAVNVQHFRSIEISIEIQGMST